MFDVAPTIGQRGPTKPSSSIHRSCAFGTVVPNVGGRDSSFSLCDWFLLQTVPCRLHSLSSLYLGFSVCLFPTW